ncbi:unnamed protein product, partial [Allacma fusca]
MVYSAANRRSRRRTREPWTSRSRSSSSSSGEDPQLPPTPCPTTEPSVLERKRRDRTDSKSSLDQAPPTPNFSMDSILYSDKPNTPAPFIPNPPSSDISLSDYPLPPTPSIPRRLSPALPPTPKPVPTTTSVQTVVARKQTPNTSSPYYAPRNVASKELENSWMESANIQIQ